MRAVHFPYDRNNPYQRCLTAGLRSLGVSVEAGVASPWLPLRQVGWSGGGADVVHLHWLKTMLTAGSLHRTLVKGTLFVLHLRRLRRAGVKLAWTAHNLKPHEPRFERMERRFRSSVARLADEIGRAHV